MITIFTKECHLSLVLAFVLLLDGCASSPSKGPALTYLSLSGMIDGSDKFIFVPGKVTWVHLNWSNPSEMKFCGEPWTDLKKTPPMWAVLSGLDLAKASIVRRQGRDVIALESTKDGFTLYVSDSPNGAALYSVVIAIPQKAQR